MTGVEDPTGTETTKEQLRVGVELRSDLAERFGDGESQAAGEFRAALLAYVTELVESLGIPAEPLVTVGSYAPEPVPDPAAEDADPDSDPEPERKTEPYRVRIGDRACALALPWEIADEAAAERVAEAVAGTIAANRELLIDPTIAGRLFREWQAGSARVAGTQLSTEAFQVVLADLVRYCISVAPRPLDEVAAQPGSDMEPRTESPDELREAIIGAWNAPSITVFIEPVLLSRRAGESSARPDYDLADTPATLLELFLEELGVLLPLVRFEGDPDLADGRFRFQINDLRFPPLQGLRVDEVLVATTVENLAGRGVESREGTNPTRQDVAAIVAFDDAVVAALEADGYFTLKPRSYIAFTARRELRRVAGSFLLADVLMFQLDRLSDDDPVLMDIALGRFDRPLVTAVFRRLLDEETSIRDASGILESMLAVGSGVRVDQSIYDLIAPDAAALWPVPQGIELSSPGVEQYADCARRHLRWQVTRELVDADDRIRVLSVDKRLESRLRQVSRPLDEDERDQLRRSVAKSYEPFARSGSGVVVLTNSEVRRELRRLLERGFPALPVLSRDEVAPGTKLQTVDEIAWA